MSPKVLVPITDGSEIIETVTVVDALTRCGAEVTLASAMDRLEVHCSPGVNLLAQCQLDECVSNSWDLVYCPGGPGARNLSECQSLKGILENQNREHKLIGAICAAPAEILAKQNLLNEKSATCYPSEQFCSKLPDYKNEPVVVSDNVITSKGPGTAIEFSLVLADMLFGHEKSEQLRQELVFQV